MSDASSESPTEICVSLRAGAAGLAVTAIGLVGLVAAAVLIVVLNGLNIVTGVIAMLAALATVVVFVDLPIRTAFDIHGIHRSTPLRRHLIEWSDVDRLVRMRRGGLRRPGSDKFRGIVAVTGRKRTVLVDGTETAEENIRLRGVLSEVLEADRYTALIPRSVPATEGTQGGPHG